MLGLSLAMNAAVNSALVTIARALKFNLNTNSQYIPVIGA